jgi:hypothetical protein
MRYWNISYIFVGTNSVQSNPDSPNWKPELFLGNPNFKLVKNFNSSCLFKVDNYDTSFAFMDDFEFASPGLNLWGNNFLGNGLGSVTTISAGVNGSKSLAISAQVMPKTSGGDFEYRYWVERDVFVSDNSDTTLSFYLNATKGFSGKDTFAVLISNTQKSQTIVITTPNGVYQGYPSATTLDGYHGLFSYNLSKMWQQTFNSSLPHMLVLQLVNYDFDGVPNIAYIDNIAVTSKPVAIS